MLGMYVAFYLPTGYGVVWRERDAEIAPRARDAALAIPGFAPGGVGRIGAQVHRVHRGRRDRGFESFSLSDQGFRTGDIANGTYLRHG